MYPHSRSASSLDDIHSPHVLPLNLVLAKMLLLLALYRRP